MMTSISSTDCHGYVPLVVRARRALSSHGEATAFPLLSRRSYGYPVPVDWKIFQARLALRDPNAGHIQ
jgi:hypothetical protein